MVDMKWNTFFAQRNPMTLRERQKATNLKITFWLIFTVSMLIGSNAFAQAANIGGICSLVTTLTQIAKATAVLAIIVFAINSMFGKSSIIAEVITNVVMALVVISAASFIVAKVLPGSGGC